MVKKFLILVLVLVFLVPGSVALADYKSEYSLTYNVSPAFPWGMGVEYFADIVRDRTDGRINIRGYGGSTLAAGQQTMIFPLVTTGAIDFAFESTINLSPQVREFNLFSLPFFFEDYNAVDAVLNGEAGQMILDKVETMGVYAFGWGENGFREITNSRRSIATPQDMGGLKYRVVGSSIFIDLFRELRANPLTMNWAEATTAFQQGVVDGQENPTVCVLIPLRIWEFHEYITLWGATLDPIVLIVNERIFNSFTPEDQEIVAEAAAEALYFQKMLTRYGLDDGTAQEFIDAKIADGSDLGYAKNFLETWKLEDGTNDPIRFLESQGMHVTVLTSEQKAAFREITQPVYNKWISRIGLDVYEAALRDME